MIARSRPGGHLRHSAVTVIVVLFGLAGACTSATPQPATPVRAIVKVTATPTPVPTTPPAPQPLPDAGPLTVTVTDIQIASTSANGMFGVGDGAVDDAVALAAVQAANQRLADYLNAMFVTRATMLSPAAVARLADPTGFTPDALKGLGVVGDLGAAEVLGTRDGSAAATAQVQIDGSTVGAVTLFYSASVSLHLVDALGPVEQSGVASFVDRGAGMELVAIEATTTFGGALAGDLA